MLQDLDRNRHTIDLLREVATRGGKPESHEAKLLQDFLIGGRLPEEVCELLKQESPKETDKTNRSIAGHFPPKLRLAQETEVSVTLEEIVGPSEASFYPNPKLETLKLLPSIKDFLEGLKRENSFKQFIGGIIVECLERKGINVLEFPEFMQICKDATIKDQENFKARVEQGVLKGDSIFS